MDPHGRQFNFKERAIFARFDDFCRRIAKLADLFSMIQQFRDLKEKQVCVCCVCVCACACVSVCLSVSLALCVCVCDTSSNRAFVVQMDGMGRHITAFFHLIKTLRHNRHDLLNFEDNAFDISYVEFLSKVEAIELQLQVCACVCLHPTSC